MAMQAVWTHGNALTIESPERLDSAVRFGWGTDVTVKGGQGSWLHIPLASPVIVDGDRTRLERVFILFKSEAGSIRDVHVFDGANRFREFGNLNCTGDHRNGLDAANTFNFPQAHSVSWGIGISFWFVCDPGATSAMLSVVSAGGDFIS